MYILILSINILTPSIFSSINVMNPHLSYVNLDPVIKYFRAKILQVALVVKNLPASAGDIRDADSIPGSSRSPGGGHDNPLQYSCLENPMDRGAWQATVYRVAESQTSLKKLSMHTRYYKPSSYLLTTKKKKKSSLVLFFQPMVHLPNCSYILS